MIQRTINLYPSAALTTTTNGSAFQTMVGSTDPILSGTTRAGAKMKVFFEVSTVTATQAALDFSLQGRVVPGTGSWFTIQPLVGTASLAWVQVTTSTSLQVRDFEGPIPAEIRAVMTTSLTSPSYVVNAKAIIGE